MDSVVITALTEEAIPDIVERFFVDRTDYGYINESLELKLEPQAGCRLLDAVIKHHLGKVQMFCEEIGDPPEKNKISMPYKFTFKTPSKHNWCQQAGFILDKIFGDRQVFLNLPFVRRSPWPWREPVIDRYYEFFWSDLRIYGQGGDEALYRNGEEALLMAREFLTGMNNSKL